MRNGDRLEARRTAGLGHHRVAAKELVEKRLGLHRAEVDTEARVSAAAEGIVEAGMAPMLGPIRAEPEWVEASRLGPPVEEVVSDPRDRGDREVLEKSRGFVLYNLTLLAILGIFFLESSSSQDFIYFDF